MAQPDDPPPQTTTHDPRLHRQATIDNDGSGRLLSRFKPASPKTKPEPPPLFVRMLFGSACMLLALAAIILIFGAWVGIANDEPAKGISISSLAPIVFIGAASLGTLYHIAVALLALLHRVDHRNN